MPQFARPDSEVTRSNWSSVTWEDIDEVTLDTGDKTESNQINAADEIAFLEVGLSNVTDPGQHTGHIVRWAGGLSAAGGVAIDGRVRVLQGATIIRTQNYNNISTSVSERSFTLLESEAANITDYTDLRLEFWCQERDGTGGIGRLFNVYWAEFEVPSAPITINLGIVSETNTPLGLSTIKAHTLGLPVETNTAFELNKITIDLGIASETSLALPLNVLLTPVCEDVVSVFLSDADVVSKQTLIDEAAGSQGLTDAFDGGGLMSDADVIGAGDLC